MTNRFERARDLRQLRFMLSAIRAHETGASPLPRLTEDLDELFLMLSDDNSKWRAQFLDARKSLEKNSQKAVRRLSQLLEAEIKRRERDSQQHG
jgi:hypothetical protein